MVVEKTMLHEVRFPKDEHCTEGEKNVCDVFVELGDFVVEGLDEVMDVETPMAICGFSAPANGRVVHLNVALGDPVKADDLLFVIDSSAELPAPLLARWVAEFACPECGARLMNREWNRGEYDPCLQEHRTFEIGECERCGIPTRRDKAGGDWGPWTVVKPL